MPLFSSHTLHPSLNQTMAYYGAGTISLFQARVTPSTLPPLIAVPGAYAHSLVAEVEQALLPLPSPESPSETLSSLAELPRKPRGRAPISKNQPKPEIMVLLPAPNLWLKELELNFPGEDQWKFHYFAN